VNEDEAVAFPENLSDLTNEALQALETRALAEFDSLAADQSITHAGIQRLTALADGIDGIRSVVTARAEAQLAFDTAREAAISRVTASSKATVTAADETNADEDEDEATETADDDTADDVDAEPEAEAEVEVEAAPVPVAAEVTTAPRQRVRPSLAAAQANAPAVPDRGKAPMMKITAAAPTSGIHIGQNFTDLDELTSAVQSYSRSLVTTSGQPSFLTVATIQNEYEHVIDGDRSDEREFEALAKKLRSQDAIESLVAGGGWCAPSETRYNFFNIACQDGMIDLPTFGVKRGGIRYPVSPSFADVFTGTFTNATNPWLWTEADDILTVTGSTNKPCVRVPCSTMDERRLECYGICLTAGNLTDNAWPEATKNYLKLLMSAHYHASNSRYISTMVSLSSTLNTIASGSGQAISADAPDFVALAAQDYRVRYGMCDDDVLEVVFPLWLKDAIKSDFARRTGVDMNTVSDAQLASLFRARNVRVQWVSDWQVRTAGQPGGSTPLVAWPDTVDFLIYAAGTFMLGNGMTLDLGVVRDSVLNAENDHTAAWMEECHLIAKFGHESRQYRIPVCVAGRTGSANITDCHVA
jgi:hypothetical protein